MKASDALGVCKVCLRGCCNCEHCLRKKNNETQICMDCYLKKVMKKVN